MMGCVGCEQRMERHIALLRREVAVARNLHVRGEIDYSEYRKVRDELHNAQRALWDVQRQIRALREASERGGQ